jgi:hypothetical protein
MPEEIQMYETGTVTTTSVSEKSDNQATVFIHQITEHMHQLSEEISAEKAANKQSFAHINDQMTAIELNITATNTSVSNMESSITQAIESTVTQKLAHQTANYDAHLDHKLNEAMAQMEARNDARTTTLQQEQAAFQTEIRAATQKNSEKSDLIIRLLQQQAPHNVDDNDTTKPPPCTPGTLPRVLNPYRK